MTTTIPSAQVSDVKLDYMNLLVTQMQNQNPLEPMSNQDMTAQLTQFSQLEQLEAMKTNFDSVLSSMQQSYGNSLLGKQVTFSADDGTGGTVTKTAVVDEIMIDQSNGETKLKVLEGTGGEQTEIHNDPYTGKTYLRMIQSEPLEHVINMNDVSVVNGQGAVVMGNQSASDRQFASSLVGRDITFNSLVDPGTGEIEKLTGLVESVTTDPYTGLNSLHVKANGDSHTVALDSVREITN